MGCAVNGPGEAAAADVGIAGGAGKGILIKKGEIAKRMDEADLEKNLLDEIEAQLGQGNPGPEVCLHMFGRLIGASLATHQEMLTVTSIVVKEQMHPTKAFDILYEGCLERLHQVGARLIEAYTGEPPGQQETVLRFHALLGQSLAFRFARETIVRRAGWSDIGPDQVALIERVVTEQVCDALRGLRWRRQGGEPR
jgi:hypothetical protein